MNLVGSLVSGVLGGTQVLPYTTTAKVAAEIQVIHPSGLPYIPSKGVSTLIIQKNPAQLIYPEGIAEYIETKAWGRQNATLQYAGGLVQEADFVFPLIDHYETNGPPHARLGSDGAVITQDFRHLLDVKDWLDSLRTPIPGLRQPPFVRIVWGPNLIEGVIRSIIFVVTKMYPDGYPLLAEVTLRYKPEPILVYTDRNKVRVP
jgi:hypothetical protein